MTDSSVEAVAREALKDWALEKSRVFHQLAHEDEHLRTEYIASSTAYRELAREIDALPSPEREPMREALEVARGYISHDILVHTADPLRQENAEAVIFQIDAALAPPTAQSGDRT